MIKKIPLFLCAPVLLFGNPFRNDTNFQGITGIINTPNAEVLEDGKAELEYSNQVDAYRIRDTIDQFTADQYFVNFGLLPNLEFGGRLANIEDKGPSDREFLDRDLSASMKYQLPLYLRYLPKIAVGIQDIAGTADRYNAKYIVLSKKIAFLRGSLGYGFASQHLDGFFGGIELKGTDWLYLLSEYDSHDTRIGVRINTPRPLFGLFDLSLTTNTNLNDDKEKTSVALNMKIPLGDNHHNTEPLETTPVLATMNLPKADASQLVTDTSPVPSATPIQPPENLCSDLYTSLDRFKEALIRFGFENIDIGVQPSSIYVAYENHVLDHNELDAIGVILGYMFKYDLPYQNFEIVVKKSNLKVRTIKGDLNFYKRFVIYPTERSTRDFRNSLRVFAGDRSHSGTLYVQNANSSYFKTRVELAPGLKTFVGTEVGVFDYLVSLRPYVHTTLYKGLDLGLLADIPLFHSTNFDEGQPFARYDEGSKLKSLLLHKSDVFGNIVNVLSFGTYNDYLGGFDNLSYMMNNHLFNLKFGYLKDDSQFVDTRKVYLGSYQYYYSDYDLFLTLTGGKYYNQDNGFDIRFTRFFGDTALTLFYQNTTSQYAGVGIEIPLTPRRVPNSRYLQVKGPADFYYSIRSTVREPSGVNILKPGGAIVPNTKFGIRERFLNRNRLNHDYIAEHILRLRDCYLTYIKK